MNRQDFSRRQFLQAGSLLLLARARRSEAIGPETKFQIGQLELGPSWNLRPGALERLAWEVDRRTSVDMKLPPADVPLASPELHRWPLLYLVGERAFSMPRERELVALRSHLQRGGLLVTDSAEGRPLGEFDRSVRQLAQLLFAQQPLRGIDSEHVLYKSFYLLDKPAGRVVASETLEGIEHDGRLVHIHCQNDLAGAWTGDRAGAFSYECVPGGERQRELAFRLGINVILYALCLDYKSDQVHTPAILKRRKWRSF